MTALDLDAIEAAEKQASPAPWEQEYDGSSYVYNQGQTSIIAHCEVDSDEMTGHDAALIVALRNNAAPLLARVRELEAELAKIKADDVVFIDACKSDVEQMVVAHSNITTGLRAERDAALQREAKLREALRTIQQWDALNPPPNDGSDLPWLRRLVDAALASAPTTGDKP